VKIQVKLLHAYQNKRPEGFAATSLDDIKILNNSQEAEFRYSDSLIPAWAPAQISDREMEVLKLIAVELCRQSVHPLDTNLDTLARGPAHHDATLPEQALCGLGFGEHHVAELDLSRSKLLLVPLQPSLIVLYEEMASLTVGEESCAQFAVITIARNGPCHELLHCRPSRVRSGAARLEPVLSLPVFVGKCNQGSTKDPIQGGLAACRGGRGKVGRGPGAPKGETGAIEVPRRERVKRSPTTVSTRRSRSLVKTPDLRLIDSRVPTKKGERWRTGRQRRRP